MFDKSIGSIERPLKDILNGGDKGKDKLVHFLTNVNGGEIDASISLLSKSGACSLFLYIQPSDEMKNTVISLVNLAHVLFEIQPSNHDDIAKDVNEIFDTARNVARSKECRSLVEVGYFIDTFVKVGDSIAEVSIFFMAFGFEFCID